MTITEISIKRPTLIVVIFTVLAFLGIASYQTLNYEMMPKFTQYLVAVTTFYPGASPSEIENSVTKKVEDALSSLEGLDNMKTTTSEGVTTTLIFLKFSSDEQLAMQDAQRKINAIEFSLPKGILKPIISNFSMDDFPIIRLGVTADIAATDLYDLVEQKIQPQFARIDGVAQVNLYGGEEREIKINVNQYKLEAYKISILQIVQAIQSTNIEFPTGKIKDNNKQITVRLSGKFKTLQDVKNIVVAIDSQGNAIKLETIADVQDSKKEIRSINRVDGINSIGIAIQKRSDGNEVKISQSVKKELKKLEEIYKSTNLTIVIANDTSDFVMSSAKAVKTDLLYAVMLVALVMLVFLHSLRNSFIILVAIPASIVSTFIGMYLFNFSLNIMSLLAMSLVVGILVDDSIVVLENIYRHLEMGKDRRTAALDGRNEIGYTALSITLVDVVVFLPISIINSMISGILRQFSLVVVVSTLISLFVSFTLTPLLASRLAKVEHYRKGRFFGDLIIGFENFVKNLGEIYSKVLLWCLRRKAITLSFVTILFISSVMLVPFGFIGSEFVAMGDRGEFIIQIELPKNTTIEETNKATRLAENFVRSKSEITSVFAMIGGTSDFFDSESSNKSELYVKMIDKKRRKITAEKFCLKVRSELEKVLTGVKVRTAIVSMIGTADMSPIQLVMRGPEMDSLVHYAGLILNEVKKVGGTSDVKLSVEEGSPELKINLDKEKMARLGLTLDMVGATMQTSFTGNTDSKFRDGESEYDIRIVLDAFDRRNMNNVENLTFINAIGQVIKLNQFASITHSTSTNKLERQDRNPAITIVSNVVGRPVGTVGEEIGQRIKKVKLPKNIMLSNEGDLKYQEEAFSSMGIAFLASILFVYLIMCALYNSYVYPFVVLFSIPLAIVGALLALALTMQSLNIFSLLGMIMLIGLVGKNAILLVDFTNQMKEQGYKTSRALLIAGKVRLRPILMTTLSMMAGMMPIALASGPGAEWKNGMAWVLIGGLFSSLLLTLVVVPVVYQIFDNIIAKINSLFSFKKVAVQVEMVNK